MGDGNENEEVLSPSGVPVRVGKVRVQGAKSTSSRLIVPEVRDILKAKNQQELIENVAFAQQRLQAYGIFKSVSSHLDLIDGHPQSLEVLVKLREKRRFIIGIGMEAAANEVYTNVNGQLINLLGGAESLKITACVGHSRTSSFDVTLLKPLSHRVAVYNLYATAYQRSVNQISSQHTEATIGTAYGIKIPTRLGQYSCGHLFDHRHVTGLTPSTPLGVRLEAGHTVKSSIQHSLEVNTTDSNAFPTKGVRCRLSQEVAGLGGDVRFLKTDGEVQLNTRIPYTPLVFSTSLQAGGIVTDVDEVPISDRFFIGGSQSVRGYKLRGVGPMDGGASLGGRAFVAAGAHIFSPLPYVTSRRFQLHLFTTGGSLLPNMPSASVPVAHNARLLGKHFAWSYGLGLAVDMGIGRLEFNYCFPKPGEAPSNPLQGLHVGVGVSFL